MMRPVGAKFWTVYDVAKWIAANVPLDEWREHGHKRNAAIWWSAFSNAEAMRDLNMREMTELIVEGSRPWRGKDVTDQLQAQYEDAGGDATEEVNQNIENDLRTFWNVKIGGPK